MSIKENSITQRKFWMNFISYIQANRAKYWNNYQQKWVRELHSCKHEFSKRKIILQVYQDWLELVNNLVEIWLRSDSNLTHIWSNLSQINDSFWTVIEMSRLSIVKILVWVIEESEVDRDQLECFELSEIEKIKIEVFNWFKK